MRGFRIEPGEIEAALTRDPQVREAVVVVRDQDPGRGRLIGYVTPAAPARRPGPARLRAALAAALPAHMVPSAIVVLDALPLTPQNKIDLRALPAPGAAPAERHVAPRTDGERTLAAIWADVLGVDTVGVDDDFFDLGGDSILAARVLTRIREASGARLTLRDVFTARTVSALAPLTAEPSAAPPEPIPAAPRSQPVPLSSAQRRLWFLDDLTDGGTEYNTGVALRLRGPLDTPALERALHRLAARHDSLRTTFATVDGQGVQLVASEPDLPLRTADVGHVPADRRDSAVERLLTEELRRPHDLTTGPLTRALLVRRAPEDHVMLLAQHHIVTDGWSVGVLTRDLAALYRAEAAGEPDGLPEQTVQYPDFALWERGRHTADAHADDLAYWRRHLAGLQQLELPTDRPRPAVRTTAGAAHRQDVPRHLVDRLRELAAGRDTTVFTVFAAAAAVLFARCSGQRDVAFGTVTNGRDRRELEDVTGFFANTVVLRGEVDDAVTVDRFVQSMRATLLDAFAHDGVPFDRVVEELAPPPRPQPHPAGAGTGGPAGRPRPAAGRRRTAHRRPSAAPPGRPLRPGAGVRAARRRRARADDRVQHGPVRRGDRGPDGPATAPPARRDGGRPAADAGRTPAAVRRRAARAPRLLEPARVGRGPGRRHHAPRAVRGAGHQDARPDRRDLRRRPAGLRRSEPARQPPRPPARGAARDRSPWSHCACRAPPACCRCCGPS